MTGSPPLMTGGCQCGAVRYAVHAEPRSPSVCHCRMCQRAAGGPFIATASVAAADFAWTKGAPRTFASSSKGLRDFCADCGTPLAFRTPGTSAIDIMFVTLDEPQRVRPVRQIGVESRLPWLHELETLPAKTTEQNAGAEFLEALECYQDTR